jgi:hypothetical protein
MAGSFRYEQGHYEVSQACGERVLFPAVRGTAADDLVVAPGFSCRPKSPTSATTAAVCTRPNCWRWRGEQSGSVVSSSANGGMMETIRHEARVITVQQVTRTSHSRLLYAEDSGEYFIGYPVSVGPYKIDLEGFHALTNEEVAAYMAGTLDLAEFAYRLSQADQASGRLERKPAVEE